MFGLLNNPFNINITCKEVLLGGPNRNELLLKKAHVSKDASNLIATIVDYVFRTSFTTGLLIWKVRCLVV
jgi:hypothetical protein